jgi:hypothetical protein
VRACGNIISANPESSRIKRVHYVMEWRRIDSVQGTIYHGLICRPYALTIHLRLISVAAQFKVEYVNFSRLRDLVRRVATAHELKHTKNSDSFRFYLAGDMPASPLSRATVSAGYRRLSTTLSPRYSRRRERFVDPPASPARRR